MKNRTAWTAVLTLASLLLAGVNIAGMPTDGDFGIRVIRGSSCTRVVTDVVTDGPGQQFRKADVIQDAGMPQADRLRLIYAPRAGDTYSIPIVRAGGATTIVQTLRWPQYRWFEEVSATALRIIILGIGLFMLWRGRDAASFYLGAFFVGLAPAWVTTHYLLPMPWAAAASIIASLGQWIAFLGLYLFARDLAKNAPNSRTSEFLALAFPYALAFAVVAYVVGAVADVTAGCRPYALYGLDNLAAALVTLLPAGMLVSVYVHETGAARIKLRWITASAIVGLGGPFVNSLFAIANQPLPLHGALALSFVAMPLGCAYVTLRHKLIDVSFVINRALIYTVMTSVIVIAFALVERTVESFALGEGVTVAFQIGATLAIALYFDRLQRQLDGFFDRVFFRQKHDAEKALLQLAHESAFVEQADTLLDRVVHEVHARLNAGVAIYQRRGATYAAVRRSGATQLPESIDADDRTMVSLRSGVQAVRLAEAPSKAGDDGLALPLASGGELLGALIVLGRPSQEAYDPDEVTMLRELAGSVAASLVSLRSRGRAELLSEIADGALASDEARARAKALLTES